MKCIQKIAHVDIGTSSTSMMQEMGVLSQLTKLCAINHEDGGEKWEPFAASLNMLQKSIRHLSIIHWRNRDIGLEVFLELTSPPIFLETLYLWGRLSVLPLWISSLSYLIELSLRENFLDGELLRQLGKLPSLVSLKLYHESFMGTHLCFEKNLFPRLKQLIIDLTEVPLNLRASRWLLRESLQMVFLALRTSQNSWRLSSSVKLFLIP
jgi:hypothetical protein